VTGLPQPARRHRAVGLTPADIVNELAGQGVTQGWDVVVAMTATKVNELFQREFVVNLVSGSDLPPVTGTVPVIRGVSVEFVDVILGNPLIAFDPKLDPQEALLTIPIISGLAHTVVTFGGISTVVSTQWISSADGYTITGVVPLGTVDGDVDTTHVYLQINNGTSFFGNLHMTGAATTVLGEYFLSFLQQHATGFDYPLGTLSYKPNGTDLTPVKPFKIATQRDDTNPADTGRVLLFVPTTYHPGGGSQTALSLANVVPDGSDVALLLASSVVFGSIVRDAVSRVFSGQVTASASTAGAWSVSVTGGTLDAGQVRQDWWGDIYESGDCSQQTDVVVPLAGITVSPSGGQIVASWNGPWDQSWSHQYLDLDTPLCDCGTIQMTATLGSTYLPSVDPVTAEISFSAQNSIGVSFQQSSTYDKVFKDGGAADQVGSLVKGTAGAALESMFNFSLPQIGAFAVANLLFPDQHATQLDSVYVPGDLISFGTLRASALTVTPPLGTVTTAGQQAFTANQPVTWSASAGTIDARGTYTAPATLPRSQVVVITATAASGAAGQAQAYAAVVVTAAQVQVAPIISVFEAGDAAEQFTASLPGSTETPAWSLSAAVGSVDAHGTYTPPTRLTEPAAVTLTAQIGTATGTAQIVVFPAMPAAVAVTPNATTPLPPGGTEAFTATLNGKPATVDWAVLPPVGTIDAAGHYQAPQEVSAPTAALVVASSELSPAIGGIAVVLIAPAAGWASSAIARPAAPPVHHGQHHEHHRHQRKERQ